MKLIDASVCPCNACGAKPYCNSNCLIYWKWFDKPVDAVEVVRCKDCKHSAIDAYANRRMCIKNGEIRPDGRIWFGTAVYDDHYCAYGAKKDGDDKGGQ